MIEKDISTLEDYYEKLKTLKFKAFIDFDNHANMFNFFWLCIPLLWGSFEKYPMILFDTQLSYEEIFYWWFWTIMFFLSGVLFFSRIVDHIKGVKQYKLKKDTLNSLDIEQLFKKYEVKRKLNHKSNHRALSQNMVQVSLLLKQLKKSKKIIENSQN